MISAIYIRSKRNAMHGYDHSADEDAVAIAKCYDFLELIKKRGILKVESEAVAVYLPKPKALGMSAAT